MTVQQIIDEIETGREERGMSWNDVYIACGVSWHTVDNWKRGKAGPRFDTVDRVLRAVGKKIEIADIGGIR